LLTLKLARTIDFKSNVGRSHVLVPDMNLLAAQQQASAAWRQVEVAIAQAILSLLAVAIAIYVPSRQASLAAAREKRERLIDPRCGFWAACRQ
jgi:hypothetical protein